MCRARNCVNNNWGVNVTTFGLNITNCRSCPLNMVTSTNKATNPTSASYYVDNGDGRTGGFVSKWACVTQPGYGFNGIWSFQCPLGTYNSGDNWSNCTACGSGLTTTALGAGVRSTDCGIAPGFGFHDSVIVSCPVGKSLQPALKGLQSSTPQQTQVDLQQSVWLNCPCWSSWYGLLTTAVPNKLLLMIRTCVCAGLAGYYNDRAIDKTKSQPCIACPSGTTTSSLGSVSPSDCSLCKPGFGEADCATRCGGIGNAGTYGQGLRPVSTPCTDCASTNLTVNVAGVNGTFAAEPTSRVGADNITDCLSNWASYGEGWHLPSGPAESFVLRNNIANVSMCLLLCTGDCQFATYVLDTKQCQLRSKQDSQYTG
jgi:hypothetical protein